MTCQLRNKPIGHHMHGSQRGEERLHGDGLEGHTLAAAAAAAVSTWMLENRLRLGQAGQAAASTIRSQS